MLSELAAALHMSDGFLDEVARMRKTLLLAATLWSTVVITSVTITNKPGGLLFGIMVSLIPGLLLFAYVAVSPTGQRIRIRYISAIVGLVALVANTQYMASSSCIEDALCGLNYINPPLVDVAIFGLLSLWSALRRRRAESRHGLVRD